jgi:hypothetical protein
MLLSLKQTLLVTRSDPRPSKDRLTLRGFLGAFVGDLACKEFSTTAKHFTLGLRPAPYSCPECELTCDTGLLRAVARSLRPATAALV